MMVGFVSRNVVELLCGEDQVDDTIVYMTKVLQCTNLEGATPLHVFTAGRAKAPESQDEVRRTVNRFISRAQRHMENCRLAVVSRYLNLTIREAKQILETNENNYNKPEEWTTITRKLSGCSPTSSSGRVLAGRKSIDDTGDGAIEDDGLMKDSTPNKKRVQKPTQSEEGRDVNQTLN